MLYLKRIVASVVFLGGFIGILIGVSYLFIPKEDDLEFGTEDPAAYSIRGERANALDTLVLGDSESYNNITPMQIWKEEGISMFICGTRAQRLDYTLVLAERAFRNQSPKLVVLETNTIYRDLSVSTSAMAKISNHFAIFRYHDRWKAILTGGSPVAISDDYKGYNFSMDVVPAPVQDYMFYTEECATINPVNASYVEQIKELCEEKGAQLLLLSTPSAKNWTYEKHNGIAKLAEELDCVYLDLNLCNDSIGIDWKTDTRDKGDHLNYKGAVKVSSYLAGYLRDMGIFTDKRTDPQYVDWNNALARYELFIGKR